MIYLIITTTINNRFGIINYEERKNRYLDCIPYVLNFTDETIKPIVVENNGEQDTYLNAIKCDVVYTNNNKYDLYHKGMNELLDIKHIIEKYNIQDNDFIIKLTGRYKVCSSHFFDIVKENCNTYDAFVKFFNVATLEYMHYDCVLGLFAIKCKYIKRFEYSIETPKSMECQFAEFVRANVENIMEIQNLNMECCFADKNDILHV